MSSLLYPKMHLKVRITPEYKDVLEPYYKDSIKKYNDKVKGGEKHLDSGFDLYIADHFSNIKYNEASPIVINHQVQCALYDDNGNPLPYYLYPRSSISKTPFRLANQVGIIDSGYRGNLIAKVDCICGEAYEHEDSATIGMNYVESGTDVDYDADAELVGNGNGFGRLSNKKKRNKKRKSGAVAGTGDVGRAPSYNVSNNLFIRTITANRVGKYSNFYEGQVGHRMFQVCSHNLLPFGSIELVDDLDNTTRGSGGFGSTGGVLDNGFDIVH
jgi:dUTP pyrophosphatase